VKLQTDAKHSALCIGVDHFVAAPRAARSGVVAIAGVAALHAIDLARSQLPHEQRVMDQHLSWV